MVTKNSIKILNIANLCISADTSDAGESTNNCSKDEVDLTSESMCSEIGLLANGIIYHSVV